MPTELNVRNVDALMERGTVLRMAKTAISVVSKTTLAKCASLSQNVTQEGLDRPMEIDVPINVGCMKLMKSVKMTWRT